MDARRSTSRSRAASVRCTSWSRWSSTCPAIPEVLVVTNTEKDDKPIGIKRAGWGWHSDGEDKVLPNAGSFIHALELPPVDSDTMYADTYAAFAALPDDVRRKIMGRRACF